MSTLFGHVKGAFTGAQTDRAGLLRKADGGVLFLDEIGELGLDEQAMLLQAPSKRNGSCPSAPTRKRSSDFQLIAGTNRDLEHAVRRADSAKICWRASTCGRSGCRHCASAARTSSPTSTTSSNATRSSRDTSCASTPKRAAPTCEFATSPDGRVERQFSRARRRR